MPTRPMNSIADRLNAAQLAINNSLSDAEIQARVAEYGYPATKLTAGKALYTAAVTAVNNAQAADGTQQQTTARVNAEEEKARDAYQALAKVCRACFNNEPARLTMLQIGGKTPRTTAGFLTSALTLFDNALGVAEIKTALAEYGYTAQKLSSERAKIVEYDQANQAQEAAKGAAQQATRTQDKALSELDDWMARYLKIAKVALRDDRELLEKLGILSRSSKTAAQRAAPAKASATRAAKVKAG